MRHVGHESCIVRHQSYVLHVTHACAYARERDSEYLGVFGCVYYRCHHGCSAMIRHAVHVAHVCVCKSGAGEGGGEGGGGHVRAYFRVRQYMCI